MSDFPLGGNVSDLREWLDMKGFDGQFVGWEANALIGLKEVRIMNEFGLPQDRALSLYGLLEAANNKRGESTTVLINSYSNTHFSHLMINFYFIVS